jgi:Asp-tRNA(Asn)/Glu-tRNA(Gln) amidotransferase A subunit family amidase
MSTAAERLDACARATGRWEPRVHAFVTLDLPGARAAALAGLPAGPLSGVPVAVKDQIETAGLRTTSGSLLYEEHVPTADATAVTRIRNAGAVVVGKTNTPEFGLSWRTRNLVAPETRNPWDPSRTTGGSSGGSAAAVAYGGAAMALGTDDAGSVRLPSAFCGLVGLLPTVGLVPRSGVIGTSLQFSSIGPIARTAADCATLLGVLAGPDPADPTGMPADRARDALLDRSAQVRRIGWWTSAAFPPDPAVAAAARAAAALLDLEIVDAEPDFDTVEMAEAFAAIIWSDRHAFGGREMLADPELADRLTPVTRQRLELGAATSGGDYAAALALRFAAQARAARLFEQVDVLACPTVGFVAPQVPDADVERPDGITAHTYQANFLGLPACSVPAGLVDGLPVGLQLIGPSGSDGTLLALAQRLQERTGVLALPEGPS